MKNKRLRDKGHRRCPSSLFVISWRKIMNVSFPNNKQKEIFSVRFDFVVADPMEHRFQLSEIAYQWKSFTDQVRSADAFADADADADADPDWAEEEKEEEEEETRRLTQTDQCNIPFPSRN